MKILNHFSKKLTISKVLAILGIGWIVFVLIAAFINHFELKSQFEESQKKTAAMTAPLQESESSSAVDLDQE